MRRRLGRLGSGVALTTLAALALAGCTPPEPTEEELLAEARASFDGFNRAIDEVNSAGSVTAADLSEHATTEVADVWAADIQASLDEGFVSHGVPSVTDVALTASSDSGIAAEICADGRAIETTRPDGSVIRPERPVAWSAEFVWDAAQEHLLISALDVSPDQASCAH